MAADTSVVKPVDAPPLAPLKLKSRLAPTPGAPKYSVKVKNAAGHEVVLGCPRVTRGSEVACPRAPNPKAERAAAGSRPGACVSEAPFYP